MLETRGSNGRYIVQPNDTLSSIAERQLGSQGRWTEIVRASGLTGHDTLLIGQVLRMPQPTTQRADMRPQRIVVAAHPGMSADQRPATVLPAWAYHFVLADEMNPLTRRAVRKVLLPSKGVTDLAELEGSHILSTTGSRHATLRVQSRPACTSAGASTAASYRQARDQVERPAFPASASGSISTRRSAPA